MGGGGEDKPYTGASKIWTLDLLPITKRVYLCVTVALVVARSMEILGLSRNPYAHEEAFNCLMTETCRTLGKDSCVSDTLSWHEQIKKIYYFINRQHKDLNDARF